MCASCVRWEQERGVLQAAYTLFIPTVQAGVWQRWLQQLHWHVPHRPPPSTPPDQLPSLSCSLMSWQLMFVLEDTHSSLRSRAEGTFQLLRQSLDCCCPLSLSLSSPCLPLSFLIMQGAVVSSKQLCKLVGTLIVFLFVVFHFPASWFLVLFCWAQGDCVMNPYWSFKQT